MAVARKPLLLLLALQCSVGLQPLAVRRPSLSAVRPRPALLTASGEPGQQAADGELKQMRRRIDGEMVAIAGPALVGLAIDPLASLVDTAFIGRFCSTADLAGVGVAVSVFNLLARTFNFINTATTSQVAEVTPAATPAGAFTPAMASQASAALAVAGAVGFGLAALMLVGGGPLLGVLGVEPSSPLFGAARRYLAARALAAPAALSLMALQGAFRGARDTKSPLASLSLASLSNIVLDAVFIGLLGFGVTGAALATAASQWAAAALLWRRLVTRCTGGLPRPQLADCARISRAGSWLTVRTFGCSSALSYSSLAAAAVGVAAGAAHQVAFQLWLAASLLADAVAVAAQALLASALARGDAIRARLLASRTLGVGLATGLATSAALAAGGGRLLTPFSTDAAVLAATAAVWPLVVATQPLNTMAFAVDGLLFGASDFRACAVAMLSSAAPAVLLMRLGVGRGLGLGSVWAGLGLFMGLRSLLGLARIASRRGPWALLAE